MAYGKYLSPLLLSICIFVVEARSNPVLQSSDVSPSNKIPPQQGKQGILEIPKQAATIIRNFIDRNIQSYLNITTPPPAANVPSELQNSIVGNFLLGGFYATIPPAEKYNPKLPSEQTEVKPIYVSNEPSYIGHSPNLEQSTKAPTVPNEPKPTVPTTKPKVKPSRGPGVHVLDVDTSLNGIHNPYGLLINNNPDEVYWIPEEATRPSIVIPIVASTSPRPQPTEANVVETTTEDEEEEGVGEEDEARKEKYKVKKKL